MKTTFTLRSVLVSALMLLLVSVAHAQPSASTATSATEVTAYGFRANWTSTSGATGYYLDISTSSSFSNFIEGYNAWWTTIPFHYKGSGLTPGTRYYYRVRVQTSNGISAYSNTISVVTELPPVAAGATEIGFTSFRANWNALAGTTAYLLDVSTSSSFSDFVSGFNGASQTGLSKLITGLTAGVTYYYRVRLPGMTSSSNIISAKTIGPPGAWAATDISMTRFRAEWTSVTSATAYYLDVSTSSSFASFLPGFNGLTLTATTKFLTGLTPGTTYYYRVRAATSAGITPNSNTVGVVTPSQPLVINHNYNHIRIIDASVAGKTDRTQLESASVQERTAQYQFFDALGRPMQNISVQGSPAQKDVIKPVDYDEYGREIRNYLPYVDGSGDGQFKTGALGDWGLQRLFYQEGVKVSHDELPYTQTQFESSPVERVLRVAGTGASWQSAPGTQLPAHSQSWGYNDFLPAPVSGSGNVTVTLANNVLTVDFNATFANSPLKTGPIVLIDVPVLPDLDLGIIGAGAYHAYVRDRYLYVESTFSMNYPATMFGSTGNSRVVFTKTVLPTIVPRATQYAYQFNGTDEVLQFSYISPTTTYPLGLIQTGTGTTPAYYAPNTLNKTITIDEDFHEVIEYSDNEGHTVLKRVQVVAGSHLTTDASKDLNYASTYYIYDDFGGLVCVIPPEATSRLATEYYHSGTSDAIKHAFLSRWAFRYTYDARRRMIQKQVPGAAAIYMVYDARDRLVLTQDGNQRVTNLWSYTKYDELNRPIATGVKDTTSALTQELMQSGVNAHYQKAWAKRGESYIGNAAGNIHGYSNKSYPVVTVGATVNKFSYLTVTYYDTYDFRNLWLDDYSYVNERLKSQVNGVIYEQPELPFASVQGQITGTMVKMLTPIVTAGYFYLKSVQYYDDKYRVIQATADNYKGGTDRTTNLYDFVGKVLKNKLVHTTYDVSWKNVTGALVGGNQIAYSATASGWGNSGASSRETLAAGQNGWMEVMVSDLSSADRVIGLASTSATASPYSISYGLFMDVATLSMRQNMTFGACPNYTVNLGDVLRIDRVSGTIKYSKNGLFLCSGTTASTGELMVAAAMLGAPAAFQNVRASFAMKQDSVMRMFDYDHAGRLVNTWHRINTNADIVLSSNRYNELGQLIDKKLHSTQADASDAKQSVDYRYNIRGWLTSINDAALTPDGTDPKDLFGMDLGYTEDLGMGNSAMFNGNISAIKWSKNLGLGDTKENAYTYGYDPLNRIADATFKEKTASWNNALNAGFSEGSYQYDLNGNIKRLKRYDQRGSVTPMDDLTYDYGPGTGLSNQLLKVTDEGDDTKGFTELNGSANDYAYDNNGNLVWDKNKGGKEMLVNGDFDSGMTNWTKSDAANRLTFNTGQVDIALGAAAATFAQTGILFPNNPYIVVLDIERTSASGNVTLNLGGTTVTAGATGQYVFNVDGGTGKDFTVSVTANSFSGKIKHIQIKGLVTISYNQLNLVYRVFKTGDQMLIYYYDATGRKLSQSVSSVTPSVTYTAVKRTSYEGEFIYENDTLKFINTEEGRVVMTGPVPEYQYHLKDHLGNVRMTFTTKEDVESNTATLEEANLPEEDTKFLRLKNARRVQYAMFDHTNGSATGSAQRLSGGTNEKYGLAKSLSVMPGDVVNAEVYAKYIDPGATNTTTLTDFIATIVSSTAPAGTVVDGSAYASSTSSFPHGGLIGSSASGNAPNAHLTWLLFDRDYNFKDGGYVPVTEIAKETGTDAPHERLAKELVIKEPGYVYIYFSNENTTPVEVFFDDFKVEHVKSPVVQMDDYYPFGLQFNHYQRENSVQNKYLFNRGSELQTDLNLGWYSTLFRIYDPAIGRFLQVDPLADFFSGISPYNFAENNPVLYGDPSGLSPNIWQRVKAFFGVGRLSGTRAAGNQEYVKPVARSTGKPVPYDFGLPKSPPTSAPKPSPVQPTQQVAEEEPEEEPSVVSIPPAPIYKPKPKPKPQSQPQSKPDPRPDPSPFGDIPPGGLRFNAYKFQIWKSDLYSTPANDKLISDLIKVLKSSSSISLEIRGNLDDEPASESWFNDKAERQQGLINARARAIYNALRAAGVSESQLKTAPGVIQSTKGKANEGANMTTTFILTNH